MRNIWVVIALVLCQSSASLAAQENYPVRPVRLIVPSSPGGGLDFSARVLSARLTAKWQQQVLVDNRAGAAGNIGTEIVAKAVPNGYTLVLVASEFAAMPFLYEKLPYSTADFAPVTLVVSSPFVIAAHPTVGIRAFKDLLATAKERPNQLTYAHSGMGGAGHLGIMILEKQSGVQLLGVPFKGAGAAVAGAVGGETQFIMTSIGAGMPTIKSGRLRPIAVTSAKRAAILPDVPTVAESGVPGYSVTVWFGLLAPAKTPKSVVDRIHLDVQEALRLPEVVALLATAGVEPSGMSPVEFEGFLKAEMKSLQAVIKETGIRLD